MQLKTEVSRLSEELLKSKRQLGKAEERLVRLLNVMIFLFGNRSLL